MAVTGSLDTKLADLKRVGGKSQVLADAATRCQYVNQNTASFLSANDIAEYIDSQGTAVAFEREQSRGVSRLSTLRNFLTLIPLTITWIGFYNISQVKNLDLTTALSTLTPVAAFDIFFFALLIVVGLFADGKTSAVRRNATSAQQTLDSIAHLLTAQLAQRPTADPGNIKQWAQLVQQQLDEVRKVLQETAAETQKTATTTQAVVNQMQSLQQEVNRLAGEAQKLSGEAQKLSGAVGGIAGSASQIATSAQGMNGSAQAMTAATTQAAAAQAQSNQQLQTVVTRLTDASGAMTRAAAAEGAIPTTLAHLDNNLQAASKNLAATTKQIEQVERHLSNVVRAAGGQHGALWHLAPWNWGKGGVQVAPQQPQAPQQWPSATPPQGQVPPTPYNMPPPGQTGVQWQQPYAPPPGQMPPPQQQPQNAPGTPGNPVP